MDIQQNKDEIKSFWQEYKARRTREKLLRQATEQVVQVADPGIRLASGYRKKLQNLVSAAMEYLRSLIDTIPGPIVLSKGRYHEDPLVKALFSSPDEIEELLRISPEIKSLRKQGVMGYTVALLTMNLKEKTIFGHQQVGNILMRDVAQRAVFFADHRIVAPSHNIDRTKAGIVWRGLEVLATVAMEEITTLRARKAELKEKKEYIRAMQKILGGKNRSLGMFAAPDPAKLEELHKVGKALTEVEAELADLQKQIAYPEQSLEHLKRIMEKPGDMLKVQNQTLRLNWMGVRVDNSSDSEGDTIKLAEFLLQEEFRRSAVMISFDI